MKEEIKQIWIDALTSGEFKQCQFKLKDEAEYCCLGVLCELHRRETNGRWIKERYLTKSGVLPKEVMKWADITDCSGLYQTRSLVSDNDDNLFSFLQIAEIIEYHF